MSELHAFDSASPWDEARLTEIKTQHDGAAVSVYIRGTPGGFRHASPADVAMARGIGLGVVPNWESTADFFARCSIAEAKAAGVEARQSAQSLGFPDDGSITVPFSFDYQVPASGFKAALDRLNACQDGLTDAYRASVYGQSSLIAYLAHNGYGDRGHWLMASTWNLPYDITQPAVAMVQSHHADGSWFTSPVPGTDANTITQPDTLGAWWPDDSPFGGNVATVTHLEDSAVQDFLQYPLVKDQAGKTVATIGQALRQVLRLVGKQADAEAAIKAQLAKLNLQGPEAAAVQAAVAQGLTEFYSKAVAP